MTTAKNILITGGAGFLGPMLAAKLLQGDSYNVVLTDLHTPPQPNGVASNNPNLELVAADLTNPSDISRLTSIRPTWHAIFIFHGIMSVGCEENPSLSTKVNLEATLSLLKAVSSLSQSQKPRVVYASTQAVYGPPYTASGPITDDTPATPVGVYGTHKLIMEAHINDMNRRGLIDAFAVRLPTVTVRPGAPSRSAAAFLSGILREPLAGLECIIPIDDRSARQVICSPRVMIENFVRVMNASSDAMPAHIRAIYMPGISVTLGEMYEAFEEVVGKEKLGLLKTERDPEAERLLNSWPQTADFGNARRMGLAFDENCVQIYKEYVDSLKA
ncbi:putative secondary metabolism biosynthetic enzyme [Paraconiothyrium brasiliense]|uniref:Secondary metabolism biosynthetic enzyme n=1 Tax=Paraconiothyrium brasiliense TaxID=300254 RepID=A0ABR3QHL6_9PLEO